MLLGKTRRVGKLVEMGGLQGGGAGLFGVGHWVGIEEFREFYNDIKAKYNVDAKPTAATETGGGPSPAKKPRVEPQIKQEMEPLKAHTLMMSFM